MNLISKTLYNLGEKVMEAEPCGGERQVQLEHHGGLQGALHRDPGGEEAGPGLQRRGQQGDLLHQLHRVNNNNNNINNTYIICSYPSPRIRRVK